MRRRFGGAAITAALAAALTAGSACAQKPAPAPAAPVNAPVAAPSLLEPQGMEARGGARLRVLDKITARTSTKEVKTGQVTTFGALKIVLRACRENPPTEAPESAAFLEIAESGAKGEQTAFSGWMFASSPALSAMEHPVYDVWVLNCIPG
jgi:hypothetical protein